MDTETVIREVEALRVAPDEILILRLPSEFGEIASQIAEALGSIGLRGRALVIAMDDLEAYVVDAGNVRETPR